MRRLVILARSRQPVRFLQQGQRLLLIGHPVIGMRHLAVLAGEELGAENSQQRITKQRHAERDQHPLQHRPHTYQRIADRGEQVGKPIHEILQPVGRRGLIGHRHFAVLDRIIGADILPRLREVFTLRRQRIIPLARGHNG